jgi:hypothetical protein
MSEARCTLGPMLTHTPAARLSKSKLNAYRQCARRLWLEVHRPELKQETDAMRRLFGVGHQVGAIAREEYPDGILIGSDDNLDRALVETEAALYSRRPVFEATFEHAGVLIRADLMVPNPESDVGWHMAEVKSTASAKPHHVSDVATQVWVARASGVQVVSASVKHINKGFTLSQEVQQYRGLLIDTDVTAEVEDLLSDLPQLVNEAMTTVEGCEPDVRPGAQCTSPHDCPFQSYCGAAEPSLNAPTRRKGRKLEPFHNPEAAQEAMSAWAWPRCFLDFETIGHTVPVWVGARPFEQAPFQFSCHVQERDGSLTHQGFLDLTGDDPTRTCAEALIATLGSILSTGGSIVTYSGFERRCFQTLARRHPDLAPELQQLDERIVDLLPVVRASFYHEDMLGSYSIKSVLPVLAPELSYAALAGVKDGLMAQAACLEATSPDTTGDRRDQIRQELTDYCALDTLAMVRVSERLGASWT